jgi:hypothetical protein
MQAGARAFEPRHDGSMPAVLVETKTPLRIGVLKIDADDRRL